VPLIYVRPFPDVEAGRQRVSPDYGVNPVWAPDGRRLYYRDAVDNQLMVAETETLPNFSAMSPTVAFNLGPYANQSARASVEDRNARSFDLAASGDRFILRTTPRLQDAGLILVQNWIEELKARVPIN
jgi:hypothetical protein